MKQLLTLFLSFSLLLCFFGCSAQTSPQPETASASSAPTSENPSSPPDSAASEPAAKESKADSQSSSSHTTYPVTVTDMEGFDSTIEAADRIISLTTSSTQILIADDVQDRIIGVDSYSSNLLPEVEVVGDYIGPDIEKIVSLEPDVILAANSIQQDAIDQLRDLGIPVVCTEPTIWEQVPESFDLIGRIVDAPAQTLDLTKQLTNAVKEAKQSAPGNAPTSYYVLSFGDAGNWTSGERSFINSMLEIAGSIPVTKGSGAPWLEYPMEDLVHADPDCIILGSAAGSLEDFQNTPGYEDLSAVKSGHVYTIDSDLVTIPGPHLQEGLLDISQIVNAAASGARTSQDGQDVENDQAA